MLNNRVILILSGISLCIAPTTVAATQIAQQPNPNQERFLQPLPEPLPPEPDTPVLPEPSPPPEPDTPETKISVRQIEVVGNTVLPQSELQKIIQPLEKQTVSVKELIAATNAITQLYQQAGYLTSRAVLPQQKIVDGKVQILAIEGSIEKVQIQGNKRLDPNYIRQRLQLERSPLQVSQLEDRLRLLRIDTLFKNFEASLQAGSDLGQSVLVVSVIEANLFFGNTSFDNYSPPSIGQERIGVDLGIRDLSGFGDYFTASYNRSTTGGLDLWDLNYSLPLNSNNATLGLRTLISRTEITEDEFEQFEIEGESEFYEVSWRQPLIRNPRQEFALSLGFGFRNGQTFVLGNTPEIGIGSDDAGVSRSSVFRFGQDYLKRDLKGAWSMRSLFSLGTGLFDATTNPDPIPDSRFVSWLGQIQRLQRLSDRQLLIITTDLQLTPDSLLSSEQFIIGGGQSVRGYQQNIRSGDNGFRFSIEDRIALVQNSQGIAIFQIAPFFDSGSVWNDPDNPNELGDRNFLSSIGLGLLWQPLPKLNLRLDYGVTLTELDEESDTQDNELNFSFSYGF